MGIYTQTCRDFDDEGELDDDTFAARNVDVKEKRQKRADDKTGEVLFSETQARDEDEEEEEAEEDDESMGDPVNDGDEVQELSRNVQSINKPPLKIYSASSSSSSSSSGLKQTTIAFAKPNDKPKALVSAAPLDASISPAKSSSSKHALVLQTTDLKEEDAIGCRPFGACMFSRKEPIDVEEFESEQRMIKIISPAKGSNPVHTKLEKDQAKEYKQIAIDMKRETSEAAKSKSLGKIMEERCIMQHHITGKKLLPGEQPSVYFAKIHVKHFW